MQAKKVKYGDPLYFEALEFLYHEAELLDNNLLREWLETCLFDEINYTAPVRINRENQAGTGFSDKSFHYDDNRASIHMAVSRMETEYAWAENPFSRTRRFISNVRVKQNDQDRLEVNSYLLVMRNRWNNTEFQIISAERKDILIRSGDDWKLTERLILFDQTSLGTDNLSIFL